MDARFPTRLRPYSSGGNLANRIQMAGPVGPAPVTNFLFALATTHSVLGSSYTNFFNLLRVCQCCGGHFTRAAYERHLGVDGNHHVCLNHPSKAIGALISPTASISILPYLKVPWLASVPYGELLLPRFTAIGSQPLPSHTSRTRPSAPYREFGSLTALGIALYALNTPFGLPDNIFEAVRIGLVACGGCGMIRTIHAHIAHRPGGLCSDPGAGDSYYVALNADEVAVIGLEGEHHVMSIGDD
jgi:hypothetical protein